MQKKTSPLSIKDIISNQSGPLRDLYSRTVDIAILQEKLYSYLPRPLQEHIVAVSYNNFTLHLHTDNAAWATRLRFKIPEILEIARNKCLLTKLQTIRIKVAPSQDTLTTTRKSCKLSTKTTKLLEHTAQSIADPELRAVFIRLSKNRNN